MKIMRDVNAARGQTFDVLIIGGGAFAACAAWEAVLRGYSVALIEANDFGSGTSANSYKMVHGGIRYLQHFDLPRVWESCRERSALLRIAPHLVKPLPIALPTYGHGRNGKEFLGAGFLVYDALTPGRNRGIADRSRHIPGAAFMGRDEVLRRFDGIETDSLTGAAVFNDAQMFHPPRLVWSFLVSAAEKGAVCLNYVEARSLLRSGDAVTGVRARDRVTGDEFDIKSRVVLNAAGPWAEELQDQNGGPRIEGGGVYSRDTCFVIDGAPEPTYALAVQGKSVDTGSLIGREARHLFMVPWRGRRLIGVWHIVYRHGASNVRVTDEELDRFLTEFNASLQTLNLGRDDIRLINAGLVPFGASDEVGEHLEFGKRSHIVDAAVTGGAEGLVTLIGIRHTMARGDAAKALKIIDGKLGRRGKVPDTTREPIAGGNIDDFESLVRKLEVELGESDAVGHARELASLYGDRATQLVSRAKSSQAGLSRVRNGDILVSQVQSAVNEEMAITLGDVVFRRTPLAAAGDPGEALLVDCADIMGELLGWSASRRSREIQSVIARFPSSSDNGWISEPAPVWGAEHGPASREIA
jgi:glycerol-3-phosphate dehydrogenase